MDCAQVGVFEESNQVSLRSLLQGRDGRGLKAKISLEVLSNLTNKALEGQLADQELGGFLFSFLGFEPHASFMMHTATCLATGKN